MDTLELPLNVLHPHPSNANVMPEALLSKLAAHMERSGGYPPLMVRPWEGAREGAREGAEEGGYQLLDGHHRGIALRRIGRETARCEVWEVDDNEALLLLATLNRLAGEDDPLRRADLLSRLRERWEVPELAGLLPENARRLEKLLSLREPVRVRPPRAMEDMPVAVHFFLLPADKKALEGVLAGLGGTREEGLMVLVKRFNAESAEAQREA